VALRLGDAEAAEARAIEAHLDECRECRASLAAIDMTLAAAARLPVPERTEGYGAEVWARLQPQLAGRSRWSWLALSGWAAPRRLALAGGVAVLVLAAFVAGRYWPAPGGPAAPAAPGAPAPAAQTQVADADAGPGIVPAPEVPGEDAGTPRGANGNGGARDQVRRQILLVAVGDHLERSQMALVELVNAGDAPSVDISSEQAWARDLVSQNRLYRQTAAETGDAAMTSVLDELERVLVEVANGPAELTEADFQGVRQRIESQGIIFKVRALGERVRNPETRPAADGRIQG
jgi:hypothetical protein